MNLIKKNKYDENFNQVKIDQLSIILFMLSSYIISPGFQVFIPKRNLG